MTAPTGPDVHGLPLLIDIAVLPIALQQFARLRVLSRRVVCAESQDSARERLLTYELVKTAVKHELDALFPGRELQRPGEGHTVIYGVGSGKAGTVYHLHRRRMNSCARDLRHPHPPP